MRVETDGTAKGTRVLDDDGNLVKGVQAVRRVGPKVWVTFKHREGRDIEIVGVEGDFVVALANAFPGETR